MNSIQSKNLNSLLFDAHYLTDESYPVSGFYRPSFEASATYDSAIGNPCSSIFAINELHFSDFAERGGKACFICSPLITEEDHIEKVIKKN